MQTIMIRSIGLILVAMILATALTAQQSTSTADEVEQALAFQNQMPEIGSEAYAHLQQVVELDLQDATLEEALVAVAGQADLKLMYRKALLPEGKKVSYHNSFTTVYDALWDILDGTGIQFAISQNQQLVLLRMRDVARVKAEVQETVSGTVVDAQTGEALPGVNIIIEGTATGATTNFDGNFELSVPDLQQTLVVSYIGYQSQTVSIAGREEINIELEPGVAGLDDVVVTAFGISRDRASVGYSVSEVQGEALTRAREINVIDNLSGRIAGVNATPMGGGAGSSSRILIRGTGSLQGDNQPLYVVNGMPISNNRRMQGAFESGASVTDKGDGIQHINPDDIESISVLKGGAAAALYGSQAANGVILITTKQGTQQRDGIGVEVNSNFTVGTINRYPNLQTEYGQGFENRRPQTQHEAYSTGRLGFGEKHDGQSTINFDGEMRPYNLYTVKRQMKEFYRPSTAVTNTIAFDGGSESIIYRLSLSNLDAENIQPNSGYSRQSANLNLRSFVTDKLSVTAVMQYTHDEGRNRPIINYAPGNVNWGVTLLANSVPIEALAPGYFEDTLIEKEWQHVAIATNPYFAVNRMSNNDTKNRIMSQGSITYDLLPNLYIKGDLMRDFEVWESEYFIPVGTAARPDGQYRFNDEERIRMNYQTVLGYNTSINEFNVTTLAGGSIERIDNSYTNLSGIDFITPEFHSFSNLGTTSTEKGIQRRGTNSLFVSADLDYRQTVYLSVTGRQDWFSTLAVENNNIFYPSVGGSVVLSDILELPEAISFARIRASWAQIGAATVSPYAINRTFGLQEGGHLGIPVQTMSSAETNPDLRPLTSTTREVGFDIDFADGRFGIDLTLYEQKNEDDIISTSLAWSSGATSTILNVGEINNKGVELLLTSEPVRTTDFRWTTSYNLGYNRNRVVSLAPGTPTGGTSLLGHPLSMRFARDMAYTEDGTPIYNSVTNYEWRTEPQPIGPGVPPWTMGLSNTLMYRNIALEILLDGKFGNYFFSRHHQYFRRFGHDIATLPGREEGLTVTGVDENGNDFEHHWPASFMATYYNNHGQYDALFIQDGSYIKLRSLSISYSLPVDRLGFVNLAAADISLVGRNLAILYSRTDHFDPEQGYNPDSNTQNHVGTQLPRTRNIGLNLNIKF